MTQSTDPAEERYAALVAELLSKPGVSHGVGRGFGADALKVNGSIFAMLTRGQLVVKLPRARVDQMVESGEGTYFDAGRGRPMREWLTVGPTHEGDWSSLAREALAFVKGAR